MRTLIIAAFALVAVSAMPLETFDATGFCETEAAVGANMYAKPNGCEQFVSCLKMDGFVRGWVFKCAPGTYFTGQYCDTITPDVTCLNPAVVKKTTCMLTEDSFEQTSQKEFTKTDKDGVVTRESCSDEYSFFNLLTCACDNDELTASQCILKSNLYKKYESMATIMQTVDHYQITNRVTKEVTTNACPVTAPMFSVVECGCINLVAPEVGERRDCNVFDMEPTNTLYMDNHGVTIENGKAVFPGNDESYLSIPMYAGNDFQTKMTVAFDFADLVASATIIRTLFENDNLKIAVTSDKAKITLQTSETTCEIDAPFPGMSAAVFPIRRQITVKYDGENLMTAVNGMHHGTTACTGIVKSAAPVTIGRGFEGEIDDLTICKYVME